MKPVIHFIPGIIICAVSLQLSAQSRIISQKPLQVSKTVSVNSIGDQKAINENFKLNSPPAGADMGKNFRISGYGVPGAQVEVHVTPFFKGGSNKPVLVVAGKQSPYGVQDFNVTVGSSGSWSVPGTVAVKFREGATSRKVRVFAAQYKEGLKMKNPVIREINLPDEKLKVIAIATDNLRTDDNVKSSFKVYTRTGKDITAGSPDNLPGMPIGASAFIIKGTAAPGSSVTIEVVYSGKKEHYKKVTKVAGVPVATEKEITHIKNKQLGFYNRTIGNDGKWSIPSIDPYQPKSGDVGTTLTMSDLVIRFKAFNGNKEIVNKTVTLMVVPTTNDLHFF